MKSKDWGEPLEELINDVRSGRLDSVHIHNFVRTLLTESGKCGKEMPDGSICGVKLDCHLHDWRQQNDTSRDTYWKERVRKEVENEKKRIEAIFEQQVPPHAMDLEDSVWLKRLLNKAFGHE